MRVVNPADRLKHTYTRAAAGPRKRRRDSPRLQRLDARPTLLMNSVLREKATHPDRDIGSTDYVAAGVHTAPT